MPFQQAAWDTFPTRKHRNEAIQAVSGEVERVPLCESPDSRAGLYTGTESTRQQTTVSALRINNVRVNNPVVNQQPSGHGHLIGLELKWG